MKIKTTKIDDRFRISTNAVTSLADRTGQREKLMRLAFSDGLHNRQGYANVMLTGIASGAAAIPTTIVLGFIPFALDGFSKAEFTPLRIGILAGVVGSGLIVGGCTWLLSYLAHTEILVDRDKKTEYFKTPEKVVQNVLDRGIEKEFDANMLGSSIHYLRNLIHRGNHQVTQDDMMDRVTLDAEPGMVATDEQRDQVSCIRTLSEDVPLPSKRQVRMNLINAYDQLKQCEALALQEGLMTKTDDDGIYFQTQIMDVLSKKMRDLGLLVYLDREHARSKGLPLPALPVPTSGALVSPAPAFA